jgi:hypothetical protein
MEVTRHDEHFKTHAGRRKFFDLFEALASPIAQEALERIGRLYVIEKAIRGRSAEERQAQRQQHAVPILIELQAWMLERLAQVDKGSAFAAAFNYAFNNWGALQRYTQDGRLEIDNSIAERSVRGAVTVLSLCASFLSVCKHWNLVFVIDATRATLSGDGGGDAFVFQIACADLMERQTRPVERREFHP